MGSAHPPFEYLVSSSQASLESFELARLNAVANLRKEFRQLVDEWIEAEIEARMARWVLETRRLETRDSQQPLPGLSVHATGPTLALDTLPLALPSGDPQSASQGEVGPSHVPGCGRTSPTAERPPSSTRRLPAKRKLFSEDVARTDPEDGGAASPIKRGRHEAAPNSAAAVAALQSLERVLHACANVLQCDPAVPQHMPSGDPLAGAGQMHFSNCSAAQGKLFDSTQPESRIRLHAAPDREPRQRPSLRTAPGQTSTKQVRDEVMRGPSFPSHPVQKRRALFPPIPLYPPRAAAAS
jgi:hypothetical protein